MTNENHKGFKTILEQSGFNTSESNNSCSDFFSINVYDRNGNFICEPMLFPDLTVQYDMQSFADPIDFIQNIKAS